MPRHLEFERLHNFRDLGGYAGADGRTVRWGRLYRSDSLSKLAGDDLTRYRELDIRTVVDLRYPWEIEAKGRVPHDDAVGYHNLSIEHRPYDQAALGADVDPAVHLADRFAEVLADGVDELGQVLQVIASADSAPVVFHCASGKDRTGIVAALVLTLLGVSRHDVVADFALTARATDRLVADWKAQNPGRTLHWPGYGQAPTALMERFLDDVDRDYGSVHEYVAGRLRLPDDVLRDLREAYLGPEPRP